MLIILIVLCSSWGFFAHRKINELAIFTLPPDLSSFYKTHRHYLREHSTAPDARRYVDSMEAPRHYLDVENFEEDMENLAVTWQEAVSKYGKQFLQKEGILPWHIPLVYERLVKSFEQADLPAILKHSAELGHYVADAHVPLHTTRNHNGQLSNQHGIHAFWESRLPELFAHQYLFLLKKATYHADPLLASWNIVKKSHSLVKEVLTKEAELKHLFGKDQQYSYVKRGNERIKTYSFPYASAYHRALNGMVEQQMKEAIYQVGCFWYSAWLDAGQPPMDKLKTVSGKKIKKQEKSMRYSPIIKKEASTRQP